MCSLTEYSLNEHEVYPKNLKTEDHFVPKSKGGSFKDPKNKVIACYECNLFKGDASPEEFLGAIKILSTKLQKDLSYLAKVSSNLKRMIYERKQRR